MGEPKKISRSDARQTRRASKAVAKGTTSTPVSGELFRWDATWIDTEVSTDQGCDWTWDLTPEELKELLVFLLAMGARSWGEIESDTTGVRERHKKHHDMSVADLSGCAQERFMAHMSSVSDSSYDDVFRFRYGGTKRVWGVRDRALFRVIWCDLKHAIYPTDPD